MNDKTTLSGRQFQAEIYQELDSKLKNSSWNSGAPEAHGLLCGLACRGIRDDQIRTRAWLFQMSEKSDIDLIEGMYSLILRDLQSDGFDFNLLLPDEDADLEQRIESLASWCDGFIQGFLYDGEGRLADAPDWVRESIKDIIEISQVEINNPTGEEPERQFFEIEEYLRVAIQVIFEELNPDIEKETSTGIN